MSRWLGDYDKVYIAPEKDSIETELAKMDIIFDAGLNDAERKIRLMELSMRTGETFYVPALNGAYRFRRTGNPERPRSLRVIMDYGTNMLYRSDRKDEHPTYDIEGMKGTRPVYRFGLETPDVVMGQLEDHSLNGPEELFCRNDRRKRKERLARYITTTVADIDNFPVHYPIIPYHSDIPYTSLIVEGNPDRFFGQKSVIGSSRMADDVIFTRVQSEFLDRCDKIAGKYATLASASWAKELRVRAIEYVISHNYKVHDHVPGYTGYIRTCPDRICINERHLEECRDDYRFLPFDSELGIFSDSFILAPDDERIRRFSHAMDLLTSERCPVSYRTNGRFGWILNNLVLKDNESPEDHFLQELHRVVMFVHGDIFYCGRRPSEVNFYRSNTYDVLFKKLPDDLKERNQREYNEFNDKYAECFRKINNFESYNELEDGLFMSTHGDPFKKSLPEDSVEKISIMKKDWQNTREKEKDLEKRIYAQERARKEAARAKSYS